LLQYLFIDKYIYQHSFVHANCLMLISSVLFLCTIYCSFLLNSRTLPTVWYFMFFNLFTFEDIFYKLNSNQTHISIFAPYTMWYAVLSSLTLEKLKWNVHFYFIAEVECLYFRHNSTLYQNAVFWLVDERGIFFTNFCFFPLFHHCRDICLKLSRYYRKISRWRRNPFFK
jgi:hypothetical protein